MRSNLYDLLKVPSYASKKSIKTSFYKLSKECHPDMNSGDVDKFKAIQNAYSILGNDITRREYDSKHLTKRSFSHTQRSSHQSAPYKSKSYSHSTTTYAKMDKVHHKKRKQEVYMWKKAMEDDRLDFNKRWVFGSSLAIVCISFLFL